MKNILIALELDDQTDILIERVVESFSGNIEIVWLLHAAAPDPDFVGYDVGPQYIRDQRAEELKEEHKQLGTLAEKLRKKGISSDGLLIQGATLKTILDEADKLSIDIIAVGRHDYSFFYKTFFSTSSDVVHNSTIPVFVVPINQ